MANLSAEWDSAIGFEPPPPQTPDCYRVCVKYRGGWKAALTTENCGTLEEFENVPNGEYYVEVRGTYDGEVSEAKAHATLIVTGGSAPVAPVYGDAPPAGNPDIAGPTTLTLTEL